MLFPGCPAKLPHCGCVTHRTQSRRAQSLRSGCPQGLAGLAALLPLKTPRQALAGQSRLPVVRRSQTQPCSPCLSSRHLPVSVSCDLTGTQPLDWAHPVQYDHRLTNHSRKHRAPLCPALRFWADAHRGLPGTGGARSLLTTPSPSAPLPNCMSKSGWDEGPDCTSAAQQGPRGPVGEGVGGGGRLC